ncbi:Nudix hydrolase 20, chloroplastic [Stylosanthes scabra]|uniref:Nudix hydrolase 20, chloroplastic n=1 Tax=Stylosanthes scabra TaxID=79078 RepID=A0ABU6W4B7_9FABA|nr:Nudix hydrolase 20, chloroplastic [Stylosanthes scabra]
MHTTLVIGKKLLKMGWCLCMCRPSLSTFSSLLYSKTPSLPFPSTFLPSSSSTTPSIKSNLFSSFASSSAVATGTFTWEDVFRISQSAEEDNNSSYLHGYFHKVQLCNRDSGKQSEFLPFVIEGQTVGFIHSGFVEHFKSFSDVFIHIKDNSNGGSVSECVSLHPMLKTAEERTNAVAYVIKCLGEEHIPGIRNEFYPVVSSFGSRVLFSLERAAAPYFGIKAYGIHMNGYVEIDGQKHLWIGKRSNTKQTYPGMLDHLVAGGLPHGIDCKENVAKECEEEAGIPRSISSRAKPVGAVSYMDIDGYRYKRDVLFCYDLKLPENFVPKNEDGEVESFKLIPVRQVAEVIRKTQFFKANCSLVIIDFLFRHGYISPENVGYLDLLRSLRIGDCS